MSCQFALKCHADLYFISQFITLGECNPCYLYFFLFLHWMIYLEARQSITTGCLHFIQFHYTYVDASALCFALDKVLGLTNKDRVCNTREKVMRGEREKEKQEVIPR